MTTSKVALGTRMLRQAKAVVGLPAVHSYQELSSAQIDAGSTTGATGFSYITLSNDIHPVVGEGRLGRGLEPEVVANVMRLTTRFLTAPACLSFMHAVFFGEKVPVENVLHSKDWMLSFELREPSGELTEDQIKSTLQALEKFASKVSIGLLNSNDVNGGRTEYPRNMAGGASIKLSREDYEDLKKSKENGRWDDHAWLTMRIAMTLIHELGHAVCLVTHDVGHYYFPGSTVAEEGFELEKRLFGGSMFLMPRGKATVSMGPGLGCNTPATQIMLLQWPAPYMVGRYVRNDASIGIRGIFRGRRTQPIVLFSFVKQVLGDAFWEGEEAPLKGLKALHPVCLEQMRCPGHRGMRAFLRRQVVSRFQRKAQREVA